MMLEQPIRIGGLTAQNRLVMPPMQTNKTQQGHVTDEMVAYYREHAVGSKPGVIIVEHCYVDASGRASKPQLSFAADDMIPEHRKVADAIHSGGSLAFVQLNHAGSYGIDEPVSASSVNIPINKLAKRPRELSVAEIRRIEKLFADAAMRALRAGYDGVEIHCAHGYLLNQFYSPITNKRTDDYGGALENRLRFALETVRCIRETVGEGVPVAVRLGGADYLPGGNKEEDAVEASVLLERSGVALLDISGGMCFFARPGHPEPGFFSSMTEKIKASVSAPVILTGGIKTPENAERLLVKGKADLIGVGRAMLKNAAWGAELCV